MSLNSDFSSAYKDFFLLGRGNENYAKVQSKNLVLNGTTQYAYHADTDELDLHTDDFLISFWIKSVDVSSFLPVISKRASSEPYLYTFFRNTGRIECGLSDGTNSVNILGDIIDDSKLHHVIFVADKSGNGYSFIDGIYIDSTDISSVGSISGTGNFTIGYLYTGTYFVGNLDEIRIYRFGTNGLYVSPTIGTDGEIRVGDATGPLIWSDTDNENLIKRLYYSPYSSLTSLGYSSIDDADRSEQITGTDSDMSGANNWTNQGLGTLDVNSTVAGKMYMLGDGGNDFAKLTTSITAGKYYVATLKARLNTGSSTTIRIGQDFSKASNYFEITPTGTEQTFSGVYYAESTSFNIGLLSSGFNGVAFEIDDITLKRIGEVARWKFDGDLLDTSSNSLDLTGVADPTYTDNTYINPLMYNSINPHTGTISFWITPDWDGDDGLEHRIFTQLVDTENYIYIRKNTSDRFQFAIEYSDINGNTFIDVSDWNKGEPHHIVCTWSVHSLDGTDYMHLYIDGSEVANETDAIGIPVGVEENMDYAHYNLANEADASIKNFRISHLPYKATISAAETAGLPQDCSVEYLYNSGTRLLNEVCTEYDGCLVVED